MLDHTQRICIRWWSWRARGLLAALLVLLGATPTIGCRSAVSLVTCDTLIDDVYAEGRAVTDEDDQELDHDDALALCLTLDTEATGAGCQSEYDRWLGCVEALVDATGTCLRELRSVTACIDELPYEYECGDASDNDGDSDVDCGDEDCTGSAACALDGMQIPQSGDDAVDVLFVVDFHQSMAQEHLALQAQLHYLLDELRTAQGSLRNLHLGFVSSDLGANGQSVPGCVDPAMDAAGLMVAGGCTGLGGVGFLIDVAPQGCAMTRDGPNNRCTDHDCGPAHCAHEPDAAFVLDEFDCPRCRNFGMLPDNLFDCVIGLPASQCPFRQPLEAMRLALDDHPTNSDFRRESAHLVVVLLSNTDDCSAAGPDLFDPTDTAPGSPLGPLTAFRCFEHGVTCDEEGREPGERHGCAPVNDPGGLLHPLDRYTGLLEDLAHPAMLTVATIGGPVVSDGATVTTDASGHPTLASSCAPTQQEATPGFRLRAFSDHYNDLEAAFWPFSPVCGELGAALMGVGETVAAALDPPCPTAPLLGCTDPGAADSEECNDHCRADCWVVEASQLDTPQETRSWLPRCLEVCPEDLCLGNDDPAQAYAGGHPAPRDPDLPVDACWHVVHDPRCEAARGAGLRIARREDPAPRTFAFVTCAWAPARETRCDDGLDDDGDCLIDQDDPDCNG